LASFIKVEILCLLSNMLW